MMIGWVSLRTEIENRIRTAATKTPLRRVRKGVFSLFFMLFFAGARISPMNSSKKYFHPIDTGHILYYNSDMFTVNHISIIYSITYKEHCHAEYPTFTQR